MARLGQTFEDAGVVGAERAAALQQQDFVVEPLFFHRGPTNYRHRVRVDHSGHARALPFWTLTRQFWTSRGIVFA
jgi:hypothetical protein